LKILVFFVIILSMTILIFENDSIFGQIIPTIDQLNNEAFELFNDEKYKESITKSNQVLAIVETLSALKSFLPSFLKISLISLAIRSFSCDVSIN